MLTTIGRFSHPLEAQIARARLEAAGIPAFVADEHTINMQWLYSNALGGVRLQVPMVCREDAVALLATDESEALRAEQGSSEFQCLRCGGDLEGGRPPPGLPWDPAAQRTAVADPASVGVRGLRFPQRSTDASKRVKAKRPPLGGGRWS